MASLDLGERPRLLAAGAQHGLALMASSSTSRESDPIKAKFHTNCNSMAFSLRNETLRNQSRSNMKSNDY